MKKTKKKIAEHKKLKVHKVGLRYIWHGKQSTYNIKADKLGNMIHLNPRKWLNDSAEILLQEVIIKRLQMRLNDWISD